MAGATLIIEPAIVRIIFGVAVNAVAVRSRKHHGFMTGIAFEIVMFAQQRKSGQVVDKIWHFLPAFFAVAIVALVALPAVMNFILKMAGCAGSTRRRIKYRLDMTIDASNGWMGTAQNEIRIIIVIEMGYCPLIIRVATRTIRAVMSVVFVILKVAADTFRFEFIAERVFGVTIITGQLSVLPYQFEFRIARVIESRISP